MTVSIQVSLVDTDATQGSLEVIPGSQTFDPAVSDRTRAETLPKVRVAVPKGSVVVYALHTMYGFSRWVRKWQMERYVFQLYFLQRILSIISGQYGDVRRWLTGWPDRAKRVLMCVL